MIIDEYIKYKDICNMKLVNKKFNNISIILSGIKIYLLSNIKNKKKYK